MIQWEASEAAINSFPIKQYLRSDIPGRVWATPSDVR